MDCKENNEWKPLNRYERLVWIICGILGACYFLALIVIAGAAADYLINKYLGA